MHSSQKLTCSQKKKTQKKTTEQHKKSSLEYYTVIHLSMNAFLFEVIWGISNHFFLNLEANYGEFMFIIGYMLLGINRKKIMLGNNNVFWSLK